MRKRNRHFVIGLGLFLASAAPAQMRPVNQVGDKWVFAISDPSFVNSYFIGRKVHFPTTAARRTPLGVQIGQAAICKGGYTGEITESFGSVEGRVDRLQRSEAKFKNTNGQIYTRPTSIFVLSNCKFGPADLKAVPKRLVDEEEARRVRQRQTTEDDIQDVLRQEHADCLKILARRNIPASSAAIRSYCP